MTREGASSLQLPLLLVETVTPDSHVREMKKQPGGGVFVVLTRCMLVATLHGNVACERGERLSLDGGVALLTCYWLSANRFFERPQMHTCEWTIRF